jgi:hypothetical protein
MASLGLDKPDLEHLRALPDESDEPLTFFGQGVAVLLGQGLERFD